MPWLKPVALAFQNTMLGQSHHGAVILAWHGLAWVMALGRPYNYGTNMVMGLLYTVTIFFFLNPSGTVWLSVWLSVWPLTVLYSIWDISLFFFFSLNAMCDSMLLQFWVIGLQLDCS